MESSTSKAAIIAGLLLAVLLLAAGMLIATVYLRYQSDVQSLSEIVKQTDRNIADMMRAEKDLPKFERQAKLLQRRLGAEHKTVPNTPETDLFLAELQALAASNGVTIQSVSQPEAGEVKLTPAEPELESHLQPLPSSSQVTVTRLTLTLQGAPDAIAAFINYGAQLKRLSKWGPPEPSGPETVVKVLIYSKPETKPETGKFECPSGPTRKWFGPLSPKIQELDRRRSAKCQYLARLQEIWNRTEVLRAQNNDLVVLAMLLKRAEQNQLPDYPEP